MSGRGTIDEAMASDSVNLGSNPSSPANKNARFQGFSVSEQSEQPEQTAHTGRTFPGTICSPIVRPRALTRKKPRHLSAAGQVTTGRTARRASHTAWQRGLRISGSPSPPAPRVALDIAPRVLLGQSD